MKKSFNPIALFFVLIALSFFSCKDQEMKKDDSGTEFTEYLQLSHVSIEGCKIKGANSVNPSSQSAYSASIDGENVEGNWFVAEGNMLISSTNANEVTIDFLHDFDGGILTFKGQNAENQLRLVSVQIEKSAE